LNAKIKEIEENWVTKKPDSAVNIFPTQALDFLNIISQSLANVKNEY
jgi:hypothetical protein